MNYIAQWLVNFCTISSCQIVIKKILLLIKHLKRNVTIFVLFCLVKKKITKEGFYTLKKILIFKKRNH